MCYNVLVLEIQKRGKKEMRERQYALYKGEDLLMVGNVQEISSYTGMKKNTIWSTVHHRDGKEPKRKDTYHFVIIEEEEEEEERYGRKK